jgi:hypothetical protein
MFLIRYDPLILYRGFSAISQHIPNISSIKQFYTGELGLLSDFILEAVKKYQSMPWIKGGRFRLSGGGRIDIRRRYSLLLASCICFSNGWRNPTEAVDAGYETMPTNKSCLI